MIPITNNQDAAQARYALEQAMFDGAEWTLRVAEQQLATIRRENHEWSVEWGKLIFAWWDDRQSQSWRVMAYAIEEAELVLQITRGMGREALTVALRDEAQWRDKTKLETLPLSQRRQQYARLLVRLITSQFGEARCLQAAFNVDRASSVAAAPGRYARSVMRIGGETVLCIGACDAESQADLDGIIGAGLVWLAQYNERRETKQRPDQRAKRLWFCLPQGRTQTAIERMILLDTSPPGLRVECYEVDERRETLTAVQLAAQADLLNAHPRELKWPDTAPTDHPWHERILRLAPDRIEIRRLADRDSFAINGLEFARFHSGEAPHITFGVAGLRDDDRAISSSVLNEDNFPRLAQLVREIARHRSAHPPDRTHPFYRLREEAWLESLLRQNICALDVALDDRFVYSQIPAWRGEERSVIDLLTVKHETGGEARLVVIEIKASEDPQLPLQGLDYWLRVEQARLRGEFARRGLFRGIRLADQSPLLYLVAPRLRFHRAFAIVASRLSPQIEAYQVGVNANWREGVRVRSLDRINPNRNFENLI